MDTPSVKKPPKTYAETPPKFSILRNGLLLGYKPKIENYQHNHYLT